MFEVGFSELLLIMGLALLVLGPEKLPKVVSEIGRWMGRARAMARQFREQLEVEAADSARRKQTPPDTTTTVVSQPDTDTATPVASQSKIATSQPETSTPQVEVTPPASPQPPAQATPDDERRAP